MEKPSDQPSHEPSDQPSDRPTDRPFASERPSEPAPARPPVATGGSGLAPNVAGALAYFLGALTGILFLVIDKERPFVRFHAMQSILLTVAAVALSIVLFILSVALGALPLIGWLISVLLSLVIWIGGFVLWIYLMYRAYQGDEWQLPIVGPQARRLSTQV